MINSVKIYTVSYRQTVEPSYVIILLGFLRDEQRRPTGESEYLILREFISKRDNVIAMHSHA